VEESGGAGLLQRNGSGESWTSTRGRCAGYLVALSITVRTRDHVGADRAAHCAYDEGAVVACGTGAFTGAGGTYVFAASLSQFVHARSGANGTPGRGFDFELCLRMDRRVCVDSATAYGATQGCGGVTWFRSGVSGPRCCSARAFVSRSDFSSCCEDSVCYGSHILFLGG
jgi:hypothetical protein